MSAIYEFDGEERAPPVEQFCRYLSERSPQPMVAVEGMTHVVSYVNSAFARLVGKERFELIGRPFVEAVPEGEENCCLTLLDRVFRTGLPECLAEQEHRHEQPGPVYWSYSVWAILGVDELPAGVMIQVTDATETALYRRQAMGMNEALLVSGLRQHELMTAADLLSVKLQAAVQSRDHFLAVLSHELRNPLAALSNGLQLLQAARKNSGLVDSSRSMMERQLKQLVRLVDDLLDVSRISTGKLVLRKERVDLLAVVRNAVEASRAQLDRDNHTLTLTLPPGPVLVDADPLRLGQVFLNLLNNAAKYSELGGCILLSVKREVNEAVVTIRDTGIGIDAAHLPHVFDIFVQVDTAWQRAQGGLGIGLSLVKEFVGLHGGQVEAHSDGLGKGSEFIVRLLAAQEAVVAAPPAAMLEPSLAPLRRILLVDDNRDAAEALALVLGFLGHEVRTAHDGAAGVAAAAEFRPELILMDLGMPGLNGYEAALRIRAEPRGNVPFLVALTGWGADDDRQRTQEGGFDGHLVKPVDLDALTKIIAEMPFGAARS